MRAAAEQAPARRVRGSEVRIRCAQDPLARVPPRRANLSRRRKFISRSTGLMSAVYILAAMESQWLLDRQGMPRRLCTEVEWMINGTIKDT